MPRFLAARPLAGALLFVMALGACRDHTTGPEAELETVGLSVQASAADGQVALLVVEVTGPGQSTPIIGNFPFEDGKASGVLSVPVGQRTFTARAFHEQGFVTHEGSVTQVIRPGEPLVRLHLAPVASNVLIEVLLSTFSIELSHEEAQIEVGEVFQFGAVVRRPDGSQSPDAVLTWGSSNTAVAEVDAYGVASGYFHGPAVLVASYRGVSAEIRLRVRSPFRDIPATVILQDSEPMEALANVLAVEAEPDNPNWPYVMHGVVVSPHGAFAPTQVRWQGNIAGAVAPMFTCPLQFTLGAVLDPQQGFDMSWPMDYLVNGGRDSARNTACEIAGELNQQIPDVNRVASLAEILIALMSPPELEMGKIIVQ